MPTIAQQSWSWHANLSPCPLPFPLYPFSTSHQCLYSSPLVWWICTREMWIIDLTPNQTFSRFKTLSQCTGGGKTGGWHKVESDHILRETKGCPNGPASLALPYQLCGSAKSADDDLRVQSFLHVGFHLFQKFCSQQGH